MPDRIAVLGASGHGKVIAALVRATGGEVTAFYDDDSSKWGVPFFDGVRVEGALVEALGKDHVCVIAIGENRVRQTVVERLGPGAAYAALIHPSAWVAPTVVFGPGTVVFAGAVIQPDAVLGSHVIVNTGASIDHDCTIGSFAHVAPGARLAGGVTLGEGTLIGTGASVIPGRSVGTWSTVGAGAAVVNDIGDHVTAVGVPARVLVRPYEDSES